MNCFSATGHVKTTPERRENAKGRTAAHFIIEIEDEVFPGRSRYSVACLDNDAEYALAKLKPGTEIFVQGRVRYNGGGVTIYARQLRGLI